MNRRGWRSAAGLLVTAALFAGCGGGGDGPSKEEYIRQADAICADYNTRLADIPGTRMGNSLESLLEQGKAVAEEKLNKLKALKRPRGKDPRVDEVFRTGDAVLGHYRRVTAENFLQSYEELRPLVMDAERVAHEYGFVECDNLAL